VAELREVLLQTVVYCGIPAAHTAFKVAQEVLGPVPDPPHAGNPATLTTEGEGKDAG
jgi:hypothetical protein